MRIWIIIVLTITSLLGGIFIGKLTLTNAKPTVYLLNQNRLLTIAALGMLSNVTDKSELGEKLSPNEMTQIKGVMEKLSQLLTANYQDKAIVIEKKDKTLELHSSTKTVDITLEVAKKLLGDEKWEQIGKKFLQ